MSERTCPFDRRPPPSWYRPCPDCGATRFDPCPVKAAADAAARDRLAAENARLKVTLVDLLSWFDDDGMFKNYRGGVRAAFSARIAEARALLASPDE